MYGFGYNDSGLMILIIIALVLSLIAQSKVTGTFNKYSKVKSIRGYTGADVAKMLLQQNGVTDVEVREVGGVLSDNFNPINKTVNLSKAVFSSTSLAAISVAAHETAHALQHNRGYIPLKFRSAMFPIVSFSSKLAMPLFAIGVFISGVINSYIIALIGAILFAAVVLFQIVTLPVEFNASSDALKMLVEFGYLTPDENKGAKKVLTAAALTYIAATAMAILQLLRILAMISGGRRRK